MTPACACTPIRSGATTCRRMRARSRSFWSSSSTEVGVDGVFCDHPDVAVRVRDALARFNRHDPTVPAAAWTGIGKLPTVNRAMEGAP